MGYWRTVFRRTWRDTADALGLGTGEKVLIALASQGMIGVLVYFALGPAALKASEPVRLIAAAAPFAMFPLLFLLRLPRTPAALDRERLAEIERLAALQQSVEQHRELRRDLGRLLRQCDGLQDNCAASEPVEESQISEWFNRTQDFLAARLGEDYVHRFMSNAGLDDRVLTSPEIPERNKQLWAFLYLRSARLNSFLEAIPDRPA